MLAGRSLARASRQTFSLRLEGGGGVGSFLGAGAGAVVVGFAGVEELDVAGDDLELLAPAVVGVPFGVVQASLDGDLAALGEVLSDGVGLASEDGDVDVVGALVFAVLARAAARRGGGWRPSRWSVLRSSGSVVRRPVRVTVFMWWSLLVGVRGWLM